MEAIVDGGTKRRSWKWRATAGSAVALAALAAGTLAAPSPAPASVARSAPAATAATGTTSPAHPAGGAVAPGTHRTAPTATTAAAQPAQQFQHVQAPAPTTTSGRTPTTGAPTATTAPASTSEMTDTSAPYQGEWGLYAPDFPGTLATVDAVQSAVGRRADYVMWYVHWAGPYSQLNLSDLAGVMANGSTPVITWMSDDPTGATTITDAAVAAGRYDSYIRSWAQGLRSFGQPVLLRFDHEMNGNWYGWSPGVNGNTTAGYIAAWRHVYGIFAAAGATNVTFVWSPDVDYPGATPMASLYPGDKYVGMVALDGYNWGPLDGHVWQTPQQVFGPSVQEITAVTHRPLMIGEVGSTDVGGDKAAWISQFFAMLRSTPAIKGFVWFDADKETDWRLNSSPQTLAAFEAGLTG